MIFISFLWKSLAQSSVDTAYHRCQAMISNFRRKLTSSVAYLEHETAEQESTLISEKKGDKMLSYT